MGIENIMYFALGFLASAVLALMLMPTIWARAVRLTKARIEAATPMTMAEFRADKDQLRAEFALSTRRLEMNVETLRARLSDQLSDINRKKSELNLLKAERDDKVAIVRELEEREAGLRRRVLDLEKEGADLAQKLRQRDRVLADRSAELETARDIARANPPKRSNLLGSDLSGDYSKDVDRLLEALASERQRTSFLEDQTGAMLARLQTADEQSAEAKQAIAELRAALIRKDDTETDAGNELIEAEARIASAENRLNILLEETRQLVTDEQGRNEQLLAEKLSMQDELDNLRLKVQSVETGVLKDWDEERVAQSHLREKLNDIAADVSRLVYAVDGEHAPGENQSLFDRVQKFAEPGPASRNGDPQPMPRPGNARGRLSERMAALRDLRVGPRH